MTAASVAARSLMPRLGGITRSPGVIVVALAGILAGALTDILLLRVLRRRVDTNWVLNTFVITIGLSLMLQNAHLIFIGPEYKGIPYYWPGTFSLLGISIAIDRLMVIIV